MSHDKEYIAGIVVVCNRLTTGDENRSKDVLHPCENCRNIFRELKKKNIMSDETMISCVNNAKPGQQFLPDDDPLKSVGYDSSELTDEQIMGLPRERISLKALLDLYNHDTPYNSSDFK